MDPIYFGYLGLLFILAAFVSNIFKKLETDSLLYNILNLVGGASLTYYSSTLKSIPFVILQSIWVVFALYNLIRILIKKCRQ